MCIHASYAIKQAKNAADKVAIAVSLSFIQPDGLGGISIHAHATQRRTHSSSYMPFLLLPLLSYMIVQQIIVISPQRLLVLRKLHTYFDTTYLAPRTRSRIDFPSERCTRCTANDAAGARTEARRKYPNDPWP
ncbi:hypothetical protein P280DRAFT_335141 [Massarina eburnea CBS 473.64]|uniref:Uncharacterized protein n=1 Tax=Massarina eburnea CBS 473.64 TaxID=1395130 RepID=A0A6A6RF92_9PLEO|nr:hypothetical protein P280DRAFT_335141 [Massarina eburnea CBS 473.64]